MSNALSLADLETFDPTSPRREGERRFLCPMCGVNKPRNSAHRSFCLNSSNGLYHCKRCNGKGCLKEFWPEKSNANSIRFDAGQLRKSFEIVPVVSTPNDLVKSVETTGADVTPAPEKDAEAKERVQSAGWEILWQSREELQNCVRHGAILRYLAERGISTECARENGVCFIPNWYGRATVGFPFKDAAGEVVAISGRALRNGGLDKPASGPKKLGAFQTGALGFDALHVGLPAVILCEAPFDALSLAMAGYPALALGGTNAPTWLHERCAFRRVLLAFDADEAGDSAALKIGSHLASFGATCYRLRPQGAKDWNELLQEGGAEAIEELVAPMISNLG